MESIGLRELRQQASELVRRVQHGETVLITVSGRPAARLVPPEPHRYRRDAEIRELFHGPTDPDWAEDRGGLDQTLAGPAQC